MKPYTPEVLVRVSRYQNYFQALPEGRLLFEPATVKKDKKVSIVMKMWYNIISTKTYQKDHYYGRQ